MSEITDIKIDELRSRLDEMRLTVVEKNTLLSNFEKLVSAQITAENKLQTSTDQESSMYSEPDSLSALQTSVELTGQGVLAFYNMIVKPENKEVAERILSNKTHLADLNKILTASAIIAANPGNVPQETSDEMAALLKKKSRDFGNSRFQILLTATAVAGAMSQLGPVLGAALTGAGAVQAGVALQGAAASVGAGLKSGALWLAANPIAVALVGVTASFATYAGMREYNTKSRTAAREDAAEQARGKKELAEKARAAEEELLKATAASNALNKVMQEYVNKIEGKGNIINPTINTVLKGADSVREAVRVGGENVSNMFDSAVPYLPGAYDLYRGDLKDLPKALYAIVHAPVDAANYVAENAGPAVSAVGKATYDVASQAGTAIGQGAMAVGAAGAVVGSMAYNAIKGDGQRYETVKQKIEELSSYLRTGLAEVNQAFTMSDEGKARLNKIVQSVLTELSDIGQSLKAGVTSTGQAIYGPGDRIERITNLSEQLGKNLSEFSQHVAKGAYAVAVTSGQSIYGPGDRLKRMGAGVTEVGKKLDDVGRQAAKGAYELASNSGQALVSKLSEMKTYMVQGLGELKQFAENLLSKRIVVVDKNTREIFKESKKEAKSVRKWSEVQSELNSTQPKPKAGG